MVMKASYKNHEIETILTEDYQPVFIAIIDGAFETNQTSSSTELKCIEKAKKLINNRISRNKINKS